ncbi:hypothetical protein M5K25_012143 [Dendrobium thyrsiflorum]|uniref:Uncharacterized protein n=1 Tax=Dendrobium thyrsiflorum TaxID=117978 RepID=A0ABD0V389_DENTH
MAEEAHGSEKVPSQPRACVVASDQSVVASDPIGKGNVVEGARGQVVAKESTRVVTSSSVPPPKEAIKENSIQGEQWETVVSKKTTKMLKQLEGVPGVKWKSPTEPDPFRDPHFPAGPRKEYPKLLAASVSPWPCTLSPQQKTGTITPLTVIYDWKPSPCTFCGSINHSQNQCPSNPNPTTAQPQPMTQGRNTSHKPRGSKPPNISIPKPPLPPALPPTQPPSIFLVKSTSAHSLIHSTNQNLIPNLNSPSEDPLNIQDCFNPLQVPSASPLPNSNPITSPNKFAMLSKNQDIPSSSSLETDHTIEQPVTTIDGSPENGKASLLDYFFCPSNTKPKS